jgi:hypothetical protein
LLILRIKLLRNSLRNHPEIPNNTKNQNPEQKEIRIHNERSQQQKSNDNRENLLVNCVFIFAYDNNCLYWIENKLFLFIYYLRGLYAQPPSLWGGGWGEKSICGLKTPPLLGKNSTGRYTWSHPHFFPR